MISSPLRAVFLCPLCHEFGRLVLLDAELERYEQELVVADLDGCAHAEGFGDPEVLTLAEEWSLIEAALEAVEGTAPRLSS